MPDSRDEKLEKLLDALDEDGPENGHLAPEAAAGTDKKRYNPRPHDRARRASEGKRLHVKTYTAMWLAYRDGTIAERNFHNLAQRFGVSTDTVERVVMRGVPSRGWPSFVERMQGHGDTIDPVVRDARERAVTEIATTTVDEWSKAREENLRVVRASKALHARLVQKAMRMIDRAEYVRYRRVRGPDGKMVEVADNPTAFEMADALRVLVACKRELSQEESFWLGGPTNRVEISDAADKFFGLTPDKLAYIIENDGKLPPGVTDEMLFALPPVTSVKQ